tara:strand:- start:23 stop:322 length:300 start_codon:yes stop_codon:yes gene_type:complete
VTSHPDSIVPVPCNFHDFLTKLPEGLAHPHRAKRRGYGGVGVKRPRVMKNNHGKSIKYSLPSKQSSWIQPSGDDSSDSWSLFRLAWVQSLESAVQDLAI